MEKFIHKFGIFKNGFTLAEVLITLVIIGVIAALTIPTVVNNTQKQEFVSKLKKTYSSFAQVTNKIIAEEGSPKYAGWLSGNESLYRMYKKYFALAKDCDTAAGCFASEYEKLNSGPLWYPDTGRRRFVLADGVSVMFADADPQCPDISSGKVLNLCGTIVVDVNGMKNPNQYGRDLFFFALKEDGLYPYGCDSAFCNESDSEGSGCACKVLRENAMNY